MGWQRHRAERGPACQLADAPAGSRERRWSSSRALRWSPACSCCSTEGSDRFPTPRAARPVSVASSSTCPPSRPRTPRRSSLSRYDGGCRPAPRPSRWPRRTRRASCATSTDGDRDSVGLFQQRPSQGWGTAAADPRPLLLREPVLRRAGQGRRLPDHADHRGGPDGAALGVPGGLRGPCRRRTRTRLGADRLQPVAGSAASWTRGTRGSPSRRPAPTGSPPAPNASGRTSTGPSATCRSEASRRTVSPAGT